MAKNLPSHLTAHEARILDERIEFAVAQARLAFVRELRPDLADDGTREAPGENLLYHEVALVLARCCVRYGFDLLPTTTANALTRLEVAIAEQAAALERHKIEAESPAKADVDRFEQALAEFRASHGDGKEPNRGG